MASERLPLKLVAVCAALLAALPGAYYLGYQHAQTVDSTDKTVFVADPLRLLRDVSERHRGGQCPKDLAALDQLPTILKPVDPASLHLQLWPQIPMPHPNSVPTNEWMEPVDTDVLEHRSFLLDLESEPLVGMPEVPSDCRWVKVDDLPTSKLQTTVRCKGGDGNRSCLYENLLYKDNGFVAVHRGEEPFPADDDIRVNTMGKFGSYFWKPEVANAGNEEEARHHFKQTKQSEAVHIVTCPYTTLHFETMWEMNPGHGLWDGLYPAFLAALRFGYGRTPLRLLPTLPSWKGPCPPGRQLACESKSILETFGGRGVFRFPVLQQLAASGVPIYFERMIVGNGQMAQRWMTPDLTVPGGRSLNGIRHFRDRMYWSHNMTYRPWLPKRSNTAVRGFVVDNKRYTDDDKANIAEAISILAQEGITITQLSWGDYWPFEKQLEVLGSSDVYITGPGTGMMLAPFMPDGSVVVNLLGIEECYGRRWPNAMEEYMLEGSPFLRGLYYNSSTRLQGLQLDSLLQLFRRAVSLTQTGFEIPVRKQDNLSPEGKLLLAACERAPEACTTMLREMNNLDGAPYQCVSDAWVSNAVYEVGGFDESYKHPQGEPTACTLPRMQIRQLKRQYLSDLAPATSYLGDCGLK
eukprot:m.88392 g.88392  ORF g.88392 m.88392 type:complete len:635 (+) comp14828_c0_seq1:3-1907(+)